MFKQCTPSWREAHFEIKMHKTPQLRSTFGSLDVEKTAAAPITCGSKNLQGTTASEHFWRLRCRKSARRWGAKHVSKSKMLKHNMFGPLLDLQSLFCLAGAVGSAPCQKWGFCGSFKNNGRRGAFEEDLQRCISRAVSVQKICSSKMFGGQGVDFLREVAFWSIRWFCVTGAALCDFVWPGITFLWQAEYFRQMEWKKHKTHWHEARQRQLCSQLSIFEGSLADLLRFWCCQLPNLKEASQKFRKTSFFCLQHPNFKAASQNSFVFKLAERQIERQIDRKAGR